LSTKFRFILGIFPKLTEKFLLSRLSLSLYETHCYDYIDYSVVRESPRFSCQIIVVFSTAFFIYFEIKDAK